MAISDSTAFAAGVGGGITFKGKFDGIGATTSYAGIKGVKENGTSGNYAGYLAFTTTANGSSPIERMRVTSTGNVGIGTTAPAAKVQIHSTGFSTTPLLVRNSLGINLVEVAESATGNAYFLIDSSTGTTQIRLTTAGAPSYYNGPSNFGIGTTTPANKLSVTGNADVSGNVGIGLTNPGYQLELSTDSAAKPGTSSWTIASDSRLKDVSGPFVRGVSALEQIHPIYFRYKSDNPLGLPANQEYVGILAQEAKEAVPEAVSTDTRGYLHLTNDAIVWTIMNAVKEIYHRFTKDFAERDEKFEQLRAELDEIRAKSEILESENRRLSAEFQAIKAQASRPDAPIEGGD
jgi:hypothetical protein